MMMNQKKDHILLTEDTSAFDMSTCYFLLSFLVVMHTQLSRHFYFNGTTVGFFLCRQQRTVEK